MSDVEPPAPWTPEQEARARKLPHTLYTSLGPDRGVLITVPIETWEALDGGASETAQFDLVMRHADVADEHVRALVVAYPERNADGYVLTPAWVLRELSSESG